MALDEELIREQQVTRALILETLKRMERQIEETEKLSRKNELALASITAKASTIAAVIGAAFSYFIDKFTP